MRDLAGELIQILGLDQGTTTPNLEQPLQQSAIGRPRAHYFDAGFDQCGLEPGAAVRITDGDGGRRFLSLAAGRSNLAHHAGGDGRVRDGVDQDEAAG